MALTVEQLQQAAQIEPADLGEEIVDPDLDEAGQKAAMLAWLEANILPGANAEVAVPFRRASGHSTVTAFVEACFPALSGAEREAMAIDGVALWDFAARSYGRSEINKSVNSTAESYDRDSDQDRIQGNQRLEKLLEWVQALRSESESGGMVSDAYSTSASQSVQAEVGF